MTAANPRAVVYSWRHASRATSADMRTDGGARVAIRVRAFAVALEADALVHGD